MKNLKTEFLLSIAALLLGAAPGVAQVPAPASGSASPIEQAQKLNRQGKQDEALALYRQVLASDPNSYEAQLGAGIVLDLKGEYREARKHLQRALAVAPEKSQERALRTLAVSYAFTRDSKQAARYGQRAFEHALAEPDFTRAAEIANETGRLVLESDNPAAALEWYQKGYQTAQRKTGMTAEELALWKFRWEHAQARIAARQGRAQAAEQHVVAAKAALAASNNPQQERFFPYLTGYVALYGGHPKAAIADLEKADQRDPFILALLGQACEKAGELQQALVFYRKALASNAHNPTNAYARPLARKKVALLQRGK